MKFGLKIATEAFGPTEVVRQAQLAEDAGLDFVELSDHYHPWLDAQGHSGFTWTMLGSIAERTSTIGLATGVTCPSYRYHPAVVAQAAATTAILSDGRFTLGVGAGERLNEHVTGHEFPSASKRHEAFREALQIIRLLWQGGYQSFQGTHLQLEDARVFDLPDSLPEICVAISGPRSLEIANEFGDGLFATEPKGDLVEQFTGTGAKYAEVPMAWAPDADTAVEAVLEKSRWALLGWKVMAELPNPVNFDAASQHIKAEDVRQQFAVGPDPEPYVENVRQFVDAGFDHIVLQNAGPDPDGFVDFWTRELQEPLRAMGGGTSGGTGGGTGSADGAAGASGSGRLKGSLAARSVPAVPSPS